MIKLDYDDSRSFKQRWNRVCKSSVLFIDKRGKNFWYSLWILRNARSPDDWA